MKSDQEDADHSREETQIQDENVNVSIYMYSSSILVHSAHNITVTG